MNQQPIEKKNFREDGALEVFKIFPTIQGEGPFAGRRAIFVRLAGCNLQCPGCDTDYTSTRTLIQPQDLSLMIAAHNWRAGDLVVITGGEPFRQNLKPAIEEMVNMHGFEVQIETNGTLYQDLPWQHITIVCSPKTGSIASGLLPHIAAYKYVVNGSLDEDGLPFSALNHPNKPKLAKWHDTDFSNVSNIYLQPMDENDPIKYQTNLKICIDSVMKHGYTLGLQIHKIINME